MPNPNHRLPVGKAMMLGLPILNTGKTIAIFEASQVPEGAELFVTPSNSRLSLELEVANENAAHHKKVCEERGEKLHNYRKILRAVGLLLETPDIDFISPEARENVDSLRTMIK